MCFVVEILRADDLYHIKKSILVQHRCSEHGLLRVGVMRRDLLCHQSFTSTAMVPVISG